MSVGWYLEVSLDPPTYPFLPKLVNGQRLNSFLGWGGATSNFKKQKFACFPLVQLQFESSHTYGLYYSHMSTNNKSHSNLPRPDPKSHRVGTVRLALDSISSYNTIKQIVTFPSFSLLFSKLFFILNILKYFESKT